MKYQIIAWRGQRIWEMNPQENYTRPLKIPEVAIQLLMWHDRSFCNYNYAVGINQFQYFPNVHIRGLQFVLIHFNSWKQRVSLKYDRYSSISSPPRPSIILFFFIFHWRLHKLLATASQTFVKLPQWLITNPIKYTDLSPFIPFLHFVIKSLKLSSLKEISNRTNFSTPHFTVTPIKTGQWNATGACLEDICCHVADLPDMAPSDYQTHVLNNASTFRKWLKIGLKRLYIFIHLVVGYPIHPTIAPW